MTTEEPSPGPFYRSAWIFYLILAIVGLLGLGSHHGDITLDLFIKLDSWWQDLLIGTVAGLFLVACWRLGRLWISAFSEVELWIGRIIGPLTGSEIFALALISGFSEELLFRGAIQAAWGWPWALGLFTLLHIGPGSSFKYWTLFALIAGGLFAYLTETRGTLFPAIVAHSLVNGINLSLLMKDPSLSMEVE